MVTGEVNTDPLRRGIPAATWAGTAVFAVTAVLSAAFGGPFRAPAVTVAMALFVVGCVLFLWAFLVAVGRSRTDAISVVGVYLLSGCAPQAVRRSLLGAAAAQTVIGVATAAWRPYTSLAFGVLVPMFGLALAGFWGARFGTFADRPDQRRRPRSSSTVD